MDGSDLVSTKMINIITMMVIIINSISKGQVVCMDGLRLGGQRDGWEGSVKTYACAMPVTIVNFIIVIVVNVSENCSSSFTNIMTNYCRKSVK